MKDIKNTPIFKNGNSGSITSLNKFIKFGKGNYHNIQQAGKNTIYTNKSNLMKNMFKNVNYGTTKSKKSNIIYTKNIGLLSGERSRSISNKKKKIARVELSFLKLSFLRLSFLRFSFLWLSWLKLPFSESSLWKIAFFRLFSLALSAMLYIIALASAPFSELISTQFFLPMQKGRIARSAAELSIGTLPSRRNTLRCFSWFRL